MHIVNHITTKIQVSITSDRPFRIPQHQELAHIVEICYENCFLANAQASFDSTAFPPKVQPFFDLYAEISLALTDTAMET